MEVHLDFRGLVFIDVSHCKAVKPVASAQCGDHLAVLFHQLPVLSAVLGGLAFLDVLSVHGKQRYPQAQLYVLRPRVKSVQHKQCMSQQPPPSPDVMPSSAATTQVPVQPLKACQI
jgi:hypothetical protein